MADQTQKAEKIIERFGGIRPMATKLGIPVTTVQGWKKRDSIPDNRLDDVLAVARMHRIDLSDLIEGDAVPEVSEKEDSGENREAESNSLFSVAEEVGAEEDGDNQDHEDENEMSGEGDDEGEDEDESETFERSEESTSSVGVPAAFTAMPEQSGDQDSRRQELRGHESSGRISPPLPVREAEVRAIKTSSLISILMILLIALASATYLWPMLREHNERITSVETQVEGLRGDVADVRQEQQEAESSSMTWSERLRKIEQQAKDAQEIAEASMKSAAKQVIKAKDEIMNEGVSGVYRKAKAIDKYVTEMTAESPTMQGFVDTLDSILDEEKGRETINNAASALSAAFTSGAGEEQGSAEDIIDHARKSDPSAAAVFGNLPKEDLKAAGVMLSLSQLKDSLSQDGKPFDQDLDLLQSMVGADDPELARAIEDAKPQAKQGVFSPSGLSSLFESYSEKVVDKSLQGDDVTMADKAKATFNSLLQVEKDGELVTGTSTQAKLNKAKGLLEQGDVSGARAVIDSLPPDEKDQLKDWIEKADATIRIQSLSSQLDNRLSSVIGLDGFLSSYYVNYARPSLKKVK